MQLILASASSVVTGPASNKSAAAFLRAYELCRRGGESPDLVRALVGVTRVHLFRGAVHKAREASQETLEAAGRIQDPGIVATAHYAQGMVLLFLAELAQARERLEQAVALFDAAAVSAGSRDRVGALVYLGRTLWLLGFPDQAVERTREAEIAGQRCTDPQVKGFGLALTQALHAWCGNFDVVREHSQAILEAPWARELQPQLLSNADLFRGWVMAREGQPQGTTLIRDEIAERARTPLRLYRALHGAILVEACAALGRMDDAMSALDETLPFAETEEHFYEAELHRLRGELLLRRTVADHENAERCIHIAIDIARRQGAKSWELRATMSLARLLRDTGHGDEARAMLAEIYNWFTEGFDTADLKEAKVLLEDLK
jgi:tetratricopeptide (TPR) repeat protein